MTSLVIRGDARHLPLADCSVDAVVCDPPAGIEFMGREWDTFKPEQWGEAFDGGDRSHPGQRHALAQKVVGRNPVCRNCHRMKYGRRVIKSPKDRPGCDCDAPDYDDTDIMRDWQKRDRLRTRALFVDAMTAAFAEALRVAKPGAHGLFWALPRTSHWTATALEDAGWELRDCVTHLYDGDDAAQQFLATLSQEQRNLFERALPDSSVLFHLTGQGFPKSLDVGKAFDRMRGDEEAISAVAAYLLEALTAAGKSRSDIDHHFGSANIGQYWFSPHRNAQVPPWDKWLWLKDWLSLTDEMDAEVWRLNGRKGQPSEAWSEREVLGPGNDKGRTQTFGGTAARSTTITAPATDLAKQWDGWGTALKPAAEFWWLVRKPLSERNVALNVAKWGTGALNIDASRIGSDSTRRPTGNHSFGKDSGWNAHNLQNIKGGSDSGRWPANLLLSHTLWCVPTGTKRVNSGRWGKGNPRVNSASIGYGGSDVLFETTGAEESDGTEEVEAFECSEDCPIRLLDAQSGERRPGEFPARRGRSRPGNGVTMGDGWGDETRGTRTVLDAGGASRFFQTFAPNEPALRFRYQSKASRAERNAGLEDRPKRPLLWSSGAQNPGSFQAEGTDKSAQNDHPCVKSIALLQYLCRLITPSNGIVLDCFMGSGSTRLAAEAEGFGFVGVERDEHYCEIAAARRATGR